MNHIVLSGRLVKDNELKTYGTNQQIKNVNNTLAVRRDKDTVDFLEVRFFGKQAELINEYTKKGTLIYIQGSMRSDTFKDKEGNSRKSIYVIGTQVELVNTVVDNEEHKQMKQEKLAEEQALNEIDEEDLPF